MFNFCPLQGALTESSASQSLLELDGGIKILVDLGWDETFGVEQLSELEKQIPTISLILLTHATPSHLAAYVHCCKNFPLFTRIPVYATRPVIDLGRSLARDIYSSTPVASTTVRQSSLSEIAYAYSRTTVTTKNLLQSPDPVEIARYFSLIQPLKYSQPHQPLSSPTSPPLNGLTITAYNAGHSLGGTIWHIQHGLESIVYAVDWNQARENVCAGAAWLGGASGSGAEVIEQLRKPTALVCSSRGAQKSTQAGGRAKRDQNLVDMIKSCVSQKGIVLIPVDSSARVLEMAYLLEHAWREDFSAKDGALKTAKLYLAGRSMSNTMRYARSMLEWMDDNIVQEFEAFAEGQRKVNGTNRGSEGGPFDFKHLQLVERKAQIAALLARCNRTDNPFGRVILASDMTMEWGFSKDLLHGLAAGSKNLVILTDKPGVSQSDNPSLARTLWEWWKERRDCVTAEQSSSGETLDMVYGGGRDLLISRAARQPLDGDELNIYKQWLATQRQLQATQQTGIQTALEASADVDDASSDSSEEEEEDGQQQGKALTVSATLGQAGRKNVVFTDEDLGVNVLIKRKDVYDFDTRGKKGRDRCFPVAVRRKRYDDYGEIIRPEDFLRAEEKDEDAVPGGHTASEDDKLGKKRKWDDVSKSAFASRKRSHTNKSQQPDDDTAAPKIPGHEMLSFDELEGVEDAEPEEPSGPCKLTYSTETVPANLRIAFVDFSGLHDKRSLEMLLPLVQPRKLILVGGSQDETLALAADCRTALGQDGDRAAHVFTPAVGDWVDASVDTNAWAIKLADTLVKRLKWQNVRGLGIVTISGHLLAAAAAAANTKEPSQPEEDGPSKRQKVEAPSSALTVTASSSLSSPPAAAASSTLPVLDLVPSQLVSAARTTAAAAPLHVADLRLADLRRAMQAAGHGAEFRGEGTLLVDGTVSVRKAAEGRVEMECVALPVAGKRGTMYEVKRAIYEGLAVVAGA